MNKYIVKQLANTSKLEKNFNYEYHSKYIDRIGIEINHPYKSQGWEKAKFLGFEFKNGRLEDGDWIHQDDLELIQ